MNGALDFVARRIEEGCDGEGDEEDGDEGGGVEDFSWSMSLVWWKRKLSWMR